MMTNQKIDKTENPLLISYLTLRKAIGYVAFGIPIFLFLGSVMIGNCEELQSSISDYYHTVMRDGFVGTICAISFFLFCYRGYNTHDFYATRLAAIFALGVAFFPTTYLDPIVEPCNAVRVIENSAVTKVHFTSALLFFLTLAYMSIFLFTKSKVKKANMPTTKKNRNKIYRICGYIMVACLIILALYFFWLKDAYPELKKYDLVFWFESIALVAFGISWLTKGETFLKDKEEENNAQDPELPKLKKESNK